MKRPPPNGISGPSIIHKYYAFLLALDLTVSRFPKHQRYALGSRIQQTALEILTLVLKANHAQGYKRSVALDECSLAVDTLKILIRLAKDTKAMQEKHYLALSVRLVEVGKMLGGWIKDAKTKRPA